MSFRTEKNRGRQAMPRYALAMCKKELFHFDVTLEGTHIQSIHPSLKTYDTQLDLI